MNVTSAGSAQPSTSTQTLQTDQRPASALSGQGASGKDAHIDTYA